MIVLHTTKYGDSSLIVHGYTGSGGRESFLFRGKGKSMIHPLCIIEYTASENRKGTLQYLKEFSPKYHLDSIRSDVRKSSIAIFISEVLYRSLLLSERDPDLFSFLEDAIVRLNEVRGNFANFHLWFLVNYAAHLGFSPKAGFEGEYNPFSVKEISLAEKFMNESFEDALATPMTGEERSAFLDPFIKYIGYHLGIRLNIKSINVLHSLSI